MKFHFGIATLCIIASINNSDAFTNNNYYGINTNSNNSIQQHSTIVTSISAAAAPSPEDSAKAFTDYMAKSHVEKLKALKDLESKKHGEIQALKNEIEQLKGGDIVPAVSTPVVEGSIEDLSEKLVAYQTFMSEYIVKAQQEKYNAVKAAEAAIGKKYEDKLNALMLPESTANVDEKESKLYKERNAKIAAAANAGKSRWGNKEVERAGGNTSNVVKSTFKASESTTKAVAAETIDAADHGLRADGGVGGLTLEQRVTGGATAELSAPSNGVAIPSAQSSVFALRNAHIAKAAKAGKQSRWGVKEEQKAVEVTSSNTLPAAKVVVTPEVEAADHGLRADGGVSGPSLAERVNLGAKLLS